MPASSTTSATLLRECSVKGCSHTIVIAECRKMCERCRNTQAEQSRKKRQRKREKEDAEGTLIKRRAPSKPKPPLYRIPNVGLFTERDWPHLDERLFLKLRVQSEPLPPVDLPPPVFRKDGYARTVPPAKDEGAKELVAVRICHIKSCYQPVPVEHKLACTDCHERKTSYLQERKRKRDREAANETTWTAEDPTLQGYCSIIQFDNVPSVQNPSNQVSASSTERSPGTKASDTASILVPIGHPLASDEDASRSPLVRISPVQARRNLPPVSNEEAVAETLNTNLTHAPPDLSTTEGQIIALPEVIFPTDFFSSSAYDAPHHQVSFERHQFPNAGANNIITISSDCDDDDVNMEEAVEEEGDEEPTQSELENEWRLDNHLLKACTNGDEAEVKRLLDKGANVTAQDKFRGGNALEASSFFGFESIVQLLLDSGADINAKGGEYGNALQAACHEGHQSVAKLLLDHGADVNAQGGMCGNALQAASRDGNESLVKLLLDHGADISAQSGYYGSALQAASLLGHESVVKLLLDSGADVNAQGGEYGNALQAASCNDWDSDEDIETLVRLLLDHGAEVNAQGGECGNALQTASYWGREAIVQLLLDHGADVNAQGGYHGNALQAALCGGYDKESVVKLLLDHGADVNAQGGEYGNALQAASYWSRESIVKLLLDDGAHINAQGGKHGNALRAARIVYYNNAVVQLLLSRGAIDI